MSLTPYYQHNGVTLYQGTGENVLKEIERASIDLTVTSPPYDSLRTYEGYSFDFETIARELYRVTKPGGVVVWIVNDATIDGSETGTSFRQALYLRDVCGFNLHDTMIWNKGTFTATGSLASRYAPVFEYMFIFSIDTPKTFNPIKDRRNLTAGSPIHGTIRQSDGSTRMQSGIGVKVIHEFGQRHNIWHIPAEMSNLNRLHPAPFPESLVNDHIYTWSNPGDTVLDPFCGSGTTLKMARLNARKCIGIDIAERYLQISIHRLSQDVIDFLSCQDDVNGDFDSCDDLEIVNQKNTPSSLFDMVLPEE